MLTSSLSRRVSLWSQYSPAAVLLRVPPPAVSARTLVPASVGPTSKAVRVRSARRDFLALLVPLAHPDAANATKASPVLEFASPLLLPHPSKRATVSMVFAHPTENANVTPAGSKVTPAQSVPNARMDSSRPALAIVKVRPPSFVVLRDLTSSSSVSDWVRHLLWP